MKHSAPSQPKSNAQRFGSHVSAAGGLQNAFTEATRVGCDCLQIFVKNQRQWSAKPLTDEQITAYREAERSSGLFPVIAHASYLINLASPDETLREKSIAATADELQRCEALGIVGLVLHPGAHLGEGVDAGIQRIRQSLDAIHKRTAGFKSQILLETTAGQGTTLGRTINEISQMMDRVKEANRLGVCLDTCHMFAAGYDLRDRTACDGLVDKIGESIGFDRVRCIHTNDSRGELGSHLDRHEHMGQGCIGRDGFHHLLSDSRLHHAPRILETPKGIDEKGRDFDIVNLDLLRRWSK